MADDGSNKNKGSLSSSSKRLLRMTDDNPLVSSSSSVHAVVFNDDLLIEILLRLPVISLFSFKFVSKRWSSLITSPAFFNLRLTRFPNIHSPCGFILQKPKYTHMYGTTFVSLVNRIPRVMKNISSPFIFGWVMKNKSSPFTFGCFGANASNVEVLQSCNGLALCVIRKIYLSDKICVYNPSINMFKMIPHFDDLKISRYSDSVRLAFDTAKSPHYKVLHIRVIAPGGVGQQNLIPTRIHSSETGCWRFGNTYPFNSFDGFNNGVYWNDGIHWINRIENLVMHFKLDAEHPNITSTKYPESLDWKSYEELFEARGCMLLACTHDLHTKPLQIYQMRNEYSSWSLKYIVKFEDSSIEAFLKTWKMSTVGLRFKVLFIELGEREEESFVVMNLNGMAVKYNLLSKTLHMLSDIGTDVT